MSKKSAKNLSAGSAAKAVVKLPSGLKKILDKSRKTAVVLFDEADQGDWLDSRQQEFIISARAEDTKTFNITIAESQLDVYRSPHLLNLSKANKVAGMFSRPVAKEFTYRDLPAGNILEKLGAFEFWDFDQSEVLSFFRDSYFRFSIFLKSLANQPAISPKLPAEYARQNQAVWRELSLVRGWYFLADFFRRCRFYFYRLTWPAYLLFWRLIGKDETVWLSDKKPTGKNSNSALIDRIIAAGESPTIAELLKPQNSSVSAAVAAPQDKFKIIRPAPSRKEIEDKYLRSPFLRRGLVANPQPPHIAWPKESWSWDFGNFIFSTKTLKPLAVFCGVLIALVSSVKIVSYVGDLGLAKGRVMGEAEQALSSINQAQADLKGLDFNAAQADFQSAGRNFVSAKKQLEEIKSFVTVLAEIAPAQNTFKSGTNLIDLGENLASAANHLLFGISQVTEISDLSLSSRIKNLSLELEPAIADMLAAQKNIGNIGLTHLPEDNKEKFLQLKSALPLAISSLKQLRDSTDFVAKVLGDKELKRYLLVFQNDNELRATGGFMGSFALIDFKNGQIEKITLPAGGTYDMIRDFNELLAPPQPLQLISDRWGFQDSNWWPDFPTSAENIKYFYEKANGPTVDGVIAINSSFLGRLLEVTGPINLPEYGKTINAVNFEEELQKSIELEAKEKNKPKKILTELAPLILDKLLNVTPDNIFTLAEVGSLGLRQKEIQMYFTNADLQSFAAGNNWTGELSQVSGDYLSVNSTNIGGGKTDTVIKQKIYHQSEIQPDGRVIDKLLIERRNIGPTDDIFTTIANNSYLRIYVPAGSKLLSAAGFKGFSSDKYKKIDEKLSYKEELANENSAVVDELSGTKVYEENGKTVFANWSVLGPQKSKDLLLVYELPFRVNLGNNARANILKMAANVFTPELAAYSFNFQKQSGRTDDELNFSLVYPSDANLKLVSPDPQAKAGNQLIFETKTDTDKSFVFGFTK